MMPAAEIRQIRRELRLRQADVAELSGVKQQYVSFLESDGPERIIVALREARAARTREEARG